VSIDEQIRDTLLHRAGVDGAPGDAPTVMGRIVDRVERRRRLKLLAGGTVLALAVAVLALVPAGMQSRGDEAPVDLPNPTVKHEPDRGQDDYVPIATSPIDAEGWRTRGAQREVWLSSLDDSRARSQGAAVYDQARIGTRATAMSLGRGRVTIRIGAPRMHEPELATVRIITGTYVVRGHLLTLRLDDFGTSTYQWTHRTSGPNDSGHRLWLEYVGGSGPKQYGAPPDVVLRMLLTSSYFSYHAGF
jgi:hypothetical protein